MILRSCLLFVAVIMSDASSAQRVNLETWMNDLPPQLKEVPLIYLAIPGSHDSMTYSITRDSKLAPDAEPALKQLYPLFRGTIVRWTVTQSLDTYMQLLIGIRYFDLRLATKNDSEDFFFTHGVYADEISKGLNQVKEYVDSHPGEVVILDFQHFYGFTSADHKRLLRYLEGSFSRRVVPATKDLHGVTLSSLHRLHQQIIIVYRHESVLGTEFWPPFSMPSPWPQTDKPAALVRFLETVRRHPGMGFVHQAVLTPTPSFIVLRWLSNLREKCAKPVVNLVLPKLSELSPGPPRAANRAPVNVVIADFVEIADAVFPRTIIGLNSKLLRNSDSLYNSYGQTKPFKHHFTSTYTYTFLPQIIIVYRHESVLGTEFWPPFSMPSPWPQTDKPAALVRFLETVRRHPGMGFVHQAVLTPTPSFIVLRWLSNLREKCAKPVVNLVLPKLSELSPGPPRAANRAPVNVVIADFVEIADAVFPRTIIGLNSKLLRNSDSLYNSYG